MGKKWRGLALAAVLCLVLAGCTPAQPEEEPDVPYRNISFQEGQWYAAAYLGYGEMGDLAAYQEAYLEGASVPVIRTWRSGFISTTSTARNRPWPMRRKAAFPL